MLARIRVNMYHWCMERDQRRAELAKRQWTLLDAAERTSRTRNAAIRNRAAATRRKAKSAAELLISLGYELTAPEDLEARIHQSAKEKQT